MRLHGDREPRQPQQGVTGGAHCCSGAANEVWSYGEEVLGICEKYMQLREKLRDYTRLIMEEAHLKGTPIMRTLFYEFPKDPVCWEVEDQYLYGDRYLVAPILYPGERTRKMYLPAGVNWKEIDGDEIIEGGKWIVAEAPMDKMPVFERVE